MMNFPVTASISGIPCLQVSPASEPKGTVLLYHGWISSIHDYSFFASLIASWGYKIVVPELPHHGERGTLDYWNHAVVQQYFWEVVLQGIKEADAIVSDLTRTEPHPIAVIGNSTGGFIAAGLFAGNDSLQASIVMNGSCSWVHAEQRFRERDGRSTLTAEERRILEQYDPLLHYRFDRHKGLLMLHGKDDATIPIDSQHHFMNAMSARHIPSDNVQLVEYSNVNHHITIGMLEKSKEWLDKYL